MPIINVIEKRAHHHTRLDFGIVNFVTGIFTFLGRKLRFSESSQNSLFEKSSFGDFKVIFLNV